MRGAGLRLNVDVRRHWRCPACSAERRLPATVTTVKCVCAGNPQMRLVEGQRRDRTPAPLPEMVLPFDLSDEPVTIPENLPVPDPNQRIGRPNPRGRRHGGPDQAPPPAPPASSTSGSELEGNSGTAGPSVRQDSSHGGSERGGGSRGPGGRSRRARERPRPEAQQTPASAEPAEADRLNLRSVNDLEAAPSPPSAPPVSPPPEDFGAGLESSEG